jgi:chromosome segregation protein
MRLKYLELQGYKTFAAHTSFAFDEGCITAIVGPNGSGKSNIADAIRWVLGEQSYRALRGKRTEDMIFSGSAQRARLGMASASLTMDNDDGWLPIDFAEVTITRRAYRSGENEYLLNGSRVRLRDIGELLATSGLARRTYTVVGQGLVDAVLSLRPEDRRELFEEASGITLYQSKRAEALSRLEETRANLLRVNDIVNEIAPRLRRLERESERARHYALLSQQREGLLRTWYGYRWTQEQQNLRRTHDSLNRREVVLARRREALEDLDRRTAGLRAHQSRLRDQLGGWHRESSGLHRQMEEVQRDLAVWQERGRLLARQADELEAELAGLATREQAAAGRIADAEEDVAASKVALQQAEAVVVEAQAALEAHEGQRAELAQQLAGAQARLLDLATRANDRRSRLDRIHERQESIAEERAGHESAIADHQAAQEKVAAGLGDAAAEQGRLRAELESLSLERARLEVELAAAQSSQAESQAALAQAQRGTDRIQSRYELLSRLRAEGEGLHAGVRAVLRAASSEQQVAGGKQRTAPRTQSTNLPTSNFLAGIIGTVAQLVRVPVEYEVAIEVALGGHLQDIVVETWRDAEAAVAYLREGRRGRATFLPLDTVRPASRLQVPRDPGVVGVGADLVQAEARLAPVVEMVLGRTVVTRDLKAARRTFERLRGGFQIVTLAGEVLRSSGSVTGGEGRGQAQGQVLAREREWRDLPGQLKAARSQARNIETDLAQARTAETEVRSLLADLSAQRHGVEEALGKALDKRRDLEREAERLAQQITWRQGLIGQLDRESEELIASGSSLHEDLARLTAGHQGVESQIESVQADLERLRGDELYQRLSEDRTAAAVARGQWEHHRAALDVLRENQSQLRSQIEAKRQRLVSLGEERDALAAQTAGQSSRESVIQGWLASLSKKIEPAEAEVGQLEAEREQLERDESATRARLREAEASHSQALLAHSRQEDKLERLRRQITDDLGLVQMEFTEGLAEQPPLPLGEMVSALPLIDSLPEGVEEELHQIRAQLRRMGSVNVEAPAEYAEVLDRYTFLTTQAADLEEAARSLREVIAELDDMMRRDFHRTFQAIATRFGEKFTQLFGGGTARLMLTDPDDISQTGVEIVARPPGKRQQTLALLSGGERALTAAALIFSILEVSPPPFCILDEVDAMLDEANVQRFRQSLEALSQQTQFIVITHNRGTIQAADTIYGVSMGEDSVSRVISLRLEGDQIAAPDGSTVDLKAG